MRKALFLDRDGVICRAMARGVYLLTPEEFELIDGVVDLIKVAREKDYLIIVVTNQPQIGKGLLKETDLHKIHSRMMKSLDGLINKIFYCPHKKEDNCNCRKPKPGMLYQAAKEFEISFENSLIVGDSDKDIFAGRAVNAKTVFLKNEYNKDELSVCQPDYIINNLSEAIDYL